MITEGMDAGRVRLIANELRSESVRLANVWQEGGAQMRTLQDVWQGADVEHFGTQWSGAERAAQQCVDRLTELADALTRQVDDQETTSEAASAPGRPSTPGDAAGNSGPKRKPNPKRGDKTQPEQRIEGPLFTGAKGREVQSTDVQQGQLGDCWFITSMQAVASTNPEIIRQNVKDNGDGTYTVTLYDDGEPVEYVVTPEFPATNGDPQFADNPTDRELWPLLYEKAMAQHMGGSWEDMNNDTAERGIEAITGQDADTEGTGSGFLGLDPPPSADEIRDILAADGQVALSSHDSPGGRKAYEGPDAVVTDHLYWVQSVTDTGKLVIVNPWNPAESAHVMTYEEYRENFSHITTSKP